MPVRPRPTRRRAAARAVPAVLVAALALGAVGCTDQALVDRVAELESSQDRLRESLTELGAPDPAEQEARAAAAAEVASLSETIDGLDARIAGLAADLDAQTLELDGRITTTELADGELRGLLAELDATLTQLTDRVASLEAQFDAHRDDPFGHGG